MFFVSQQSKLEVTVLTLTEEKSNFLKLRFIYMSLHVVSYQLFILHMWFACQ